MISYHTLKTLGWAYVRDCSCLDRTYEIRFEESSGGFVVTLLHRRVEALLEI